MKKLSFDLNGKKVEGLAEMLGGTLWVHVNGRNFTFETAKKSRARGKGGASANPGEIQAPMPGKVTKVSVQVGEVVKTGQVLLVLEAMKMEYTLKASIDGKVSEIKCQAGQQVALGQLLMKLATGG